MAASPGRKSHSYIALIHTMPFCRAHADKMSANYLSYTNKHTA